MTGATLPDIPDLAHVIAQSIAEGAITTRHARNGATPGAQDRAQSDAAGADAATPHDAEENAATTRYLDWRRLAHDEIPARKWIVDRWVGCGHVTLLAGRGGIGKSLLGQQLGSAAALGAPYIDAIPTPHNVLLWAAEDDPDELWRRQAAIAASMKVSLENFADRLFVESFVDRDCTLAATTYGVLTYTPMIETLRQQIGDCRVDLVILDNIARLFAGNENSRHDVTAFIAALVGAAGGAAILLLGHTSRMPGSEFSGSSAWENSVRSRLWFDDRPPDQPKEAADAEPDADLRYLARRKANYTARDIRTLHYRDGVFRVDPVEGGGSGGVVDHLRRNKADRVAVEAVRKLISMGLAPSDGTNSTSYLPKLAIEYRLAEGLTKREIADAMRRVMTDGTLRRQQIGAYGNRTPRYGLVEA